MTTFAQQRRAWRRPAILTYGFLPFFLGAGVWAALATVLWVPMLSGQMTLASAFGPVPWHAHDFLFGCLAVVIGGSIVPSFARNGSVKRAAGCLPVPPMQRFDKLALPAALLVWVAIPDHPLSGVLFLAGLLQVVRLAPWAGERTFSGPLGAVRYPGQAFVFLGALAIGAKVLAPGHFGMAAHPLWMGGAVGLLMLAVMTRTRLDQMGQVLTAGRGVFDIHAVLMQAALAQLAADKRR